MLRAAQRVQVLKARVASRIPQVEQGRLILTEAISSLRVQVENCVEAGDGRVDRGAFQDALTRLGVNVQNQKGNTEVRELRRLEKTVGTLQRGRIDAEAKLAGVEKELAAVKEGYDAAILAAESRPINPGPPGLTLSGLAGFACASHERRLRSPVRGEPSAVFACAERGAVAR